MSPTHLLILGLIALLVFGPKRSPEIGRSLGHGLRGFKESVSGERPDGPAETHAASTEPLGLPASNGQPVGDLVEPISVAQAQRREAG